MELMQRGLYSSTDIAKYIEKRMVTSGILSTICKLINSFEKCIAKVSWEKTLWDTNTDSMELSVSSRLMCVCVCVCVCVFVCVCICVCLCACVAANEEADKGASQ
jgi:hypothetical protein